MRLYTGFDLHSSNTYLGIEDEDGKRLFKKKLPNDAEIILDILKPYKDDIVGIVVESTYNWLYIVRARSKSIPFNHKGWRTFNLAKIETSCYELV